MRVQRSDDPAGSDARPSGLRARKPALVFACIPLVLVGGWTLLTWLHVGRFDRAPFIALNLLFSLQAAYAAPLILLAQTRQADRDKRRDKAHEEHRDTIAQQQNQLLRDIHAQFVRGHQQ